MVKEKVSYIKSPLNYVGGKYKLLKEILPLFPDNINTFVDLFGGGFNVGINVVANKLVYNDINYYVYDLLKEFNDNSFEYIDSEIKKTIEKYNLSNSDKHGYEFYGCNSSDGLSKYNSCNYIRLRHDYNKDKNWKLFYLLIIYSFSNQIRFNSSGQFNMPCGKRDYNKSLQTKLKIFVEELHRRDCLFFNAPFDKFSFDELDEYDFVYCDPPYFNSVATYNENGGWTEEHERALLANLDELTQRGIRFALSNNLRYNNPLLKEWKTKYDVHYLNGDYSNCNYHKIDKSKDIEVLITNY